MEKNKIITISGEPVSGKGTTVKVLISKLKECGYPEEKIHVKFTGHEFRSYFNNIINFIQNIENPDILKELSNIEEIKQILNNSEYRKILTNTIAQIQHNNIDLSNFTIADANNSPEFSELRKIVDKIIDDNIRKLGIQINEGEQNGEIWIIDSRLAFHNIPKSFSVRLTTNPEVAAKRLYQDNTREKHDTYTSLEQAKVEREKRRIVENERYKTTYGIDLEDVNNYNLIIDTSYSDVEDIADTIIECQKCYEENRQFGKMWGSQKKFLPLQGEIETYSRQPFSDMDLDSLIKEIEEHGYIPSEEIEVINVDGINYIIEGHHRNFASFYAGKTLIPYKMIAKDDEKIPHYGNTASQRASAITKTYLYGHEAMIESALNKYNKGKEKIIFSYEDIYPGIYKTIDENEKSQR